LGASHSGPQTCRVERGAGNMSAQMQGDFRKLARQSGGHKPGNT
jgi:hypothetical protein